MRQARYVCIQRRAQREANATVAHTLTDTEDRGGTRAANAMGAHSTEFQTADDVRRKSARKTSPTA